MVGSEYITTSVDFQITAGEDTNVNIGPFIEDDGAIYVETVLIATDSFEVKNVSGGSAVVGVDFVTKTPNNSVLNRKELITETVGTGTSGTTTLQVTNENISYNEYIQKGKQLFIEITASNTFEFNESKTVNFTMEVIGRRAI